ncbi:uncharacterized protein LOC122058159 [Macadamia integrifolia]|uniref:uncharacterized protein LOC122058159 n=1 Tax=Macadamia integrifolia TaxID=60698 RepID=UPI001C52E360|nr:uncharacterized protein LOC122058159 [Macadamia integrifolia]XP_042476614.1 uncharacterized protein LOC122058159 [Macadamia integrifolia]XP_042476615.1 uncharacterized protein LOC122058159 [Macadamia integrifolia]XP_042476616.1 uncharacterized protein LOC122058159 [Macadamia integrifolia]
MAPRARRRKVGLTRMDAATDALCQLGFPKVLIRDTVKSLLKVYGGDSGWVFIEEDTYKVVIEKILENEEKSLPEKDEAQEADSIPIAGALTALEMETSDPYTAAETDADLPLLEGGASGMANSEEIQSLPCTVDRPRPKKNPCYGWISSDDDMDIVILKTNDSLRRLPIKGATESNGGRRRKSRWDVKPEDL